MNDQKSIYLKSTVLILFVGGLIGLMIPIRPAHAIAGQCKDMAINFVNNTGTTITIPSEGHKVKNPGGLEGWNNMTTGGTVNNLAAGKTRVSGKR